MTNDYFANSVDSHVLEPNDIWEQNVPAKLGGRAIRTEQQSETLEVIYLDNKRKAVEEVFDGVPAYVRAAATFYNLARIFDVPHPPAVAAQPQG